MSTPVIAVFSVFLCGLIAAQEIQHNLPDNVELVDPKDLGFNSQFDLNQLLKNVKVLPIDTNKLTPNGVKTQILTVGFDGNEDFNPDDFVLPSLPAGREEKPLAEAAFKSFKDYLKQNNNDGQTSTGIKSTPTTGKRRRVKVKKIVTSSTNVSASPTTSTVVSSSTLASQIGYATKEQKEAISAAYGNIDSDRPTRVIELDSDQIQKLLSMGNLQPGSANGSPPVIELGREQLEQLLADQNGILKELVSTPATQKPSISVTTTETKITNTPTVSQTTIPASTVEPRVINKPTPTAATEQDNKSTEITPEEKEIIHHFSISSNDNRVVSKIPNKAPPPLTIEPVRPVFRPSQPIQVNNQNQRPVTSFNQVVSHTNEKIPQYFTFPGTSSPQSNQVSSIIKQSNFEFISAPPVSFSSIAEPLVPNNNNNNNNQNNNNNHQNRPILSFVSEPVPQPQYKPIHHPQQPHLIAHTAQPNPNHNVVNHPPQHNNNFNTNNNGRPQNPPQQTFSNFPSSPPRPVSTRRPIPIPGFPVQDPIPQRPHQQSSQHPPRTNQNFPQFAPQGPPPPPSFHFQSKPSNNYFPLSSSTGNGGGRVEFPQSGRFARRPTQQQPVYLPFTNAIANFQQRPTGPNSFPGPFRSPSAPTVTRFIPPGPPRRPISSQEDFHVEESRYGPYRGGYRFPRRQPRWYFSGI